jgi:hypothetical protein
MSYGSLDRASFDALHELCIYLNTERGLIEFNAKKTLRLLKVDNLGKLVGLAMYWHLVYSNNPRVVDQARKRLVDFYLRFRCKGDSSDVSSRITLWGQFLERLIR